MGDILEVTHNTLGNDSTQKCCCTTKVCFVLSWSLCYINDNERGCVRKISCDTTTSDSVKRVERERHIATHREDRRKRMRLVKEKANDENPIQVSTLFYPL